MFLLSCLHVDSLRIWQAVDRAQMHVVLFDQLLGTFCVPARQQCANALPQSCDDIDIFMRVK